MQVRCNILFILLLCELWTSATWAAKEQILPPLASYNYGVTGDPAKIDTAFGNLGDVGPTYDLPPGNDTSTLISNPISENKDQNIGQNQSSQSTELPQATTTSINSTSPIQSFNTDTSVIPISALTSYTTEKSIVHNTTPETAPNGSASTAGDRKTTAAIDVSAAETEFPTEAATEPSASVVPSGQSVTPSQIFETGKPIGTPTVTISNATKPEQQNGTVQEKSNSFAAQPPTIIIYCLGCITFLISQAMY